MAYLNKAMLIGFVGSDPQVRTAGGDSVANFTLATTYKGNGKESTEWHNIVAWRKTAEVVEKYVTKGTPLYVEGMIRTRSWEDKDGNRRYTTEIIADRIQLLGSRGASSEVMNDDDLPE